MGRRDPCFTAAKSFQGWPQSDGGGTDSARSDFLPPIFFRSDFLALGEAPTFRRRPDFLTP